MVTRGEYCYHKVHQFSQQNNEQDIPDSKMDGMLPGDTCDYPIQLNMVVFHEVIFFAL
jgi:hypothetical protein